MGRRGCQRTLEARPAAATVKAGEPVAVTVTGYDDAGHAAPIAGATVRAGSFEARPTPSGSPPWSSGRSARSASRGRQARLVPSFAEQVTVTAS